MAYTNIYTQAHMPKSTLLQRWDPSTPAKAGSLSRHFRVRPFSRSGCHSCVPLGYRTGPLWYATTC